MTDDNYLIDARTGDRRFRVLQKVASGRSYQIVEAEDTAGAGDGTVAVRAIAYEADQLDDPDYVEARRAALDDELCFLEDLDHELLPRTVGVAHIRSPGESTEARDDAPGDFDGDPVLVCEYIAGKTLFDWVRKQHPKGLEVEAALGILHQLGQFLITVHREGYVYRDLDPRHIIVGDDGELRGLVGFGNAAEKGERPNVHKMDYVDAPYVAPEARAERSGQMLRPAADCYGLGVVLSFMLSAEEPRTVVENPLSWPAYEKLSNLEPPGAALLVARCIQPLAKSRFGRIERMLPFTTPEGLPTAKTDGFGMLLLPAPFSGVENPENNRSLKSKLTPGPLISVAGEGEGDEGGEEDTSLPASWTIGAGVLAGLAVLALVLFGVI